MPGTTPNRGFPYPIDDDPVQPPEDIQALATALDEWNPGREDVDPTLNVSAGICVPYMGSVAPTGWILANGTPIPNAATAQPALWANADPAWRAGTTLNIPDLRGRVPFGALGTWVNPNTIASTGGAELYVIPLTSIPAHSHGYLHAHTQNHDHPLESTADQPTTYQESHRHFTDDSFPSPVGVVVSVSSSSLYLIDSGFPGFSSGHTVPVSITDFGRERPDLHIDLPAYPPAGTLGLTSVPKNTTDGTVINPPNTGPAGSGNPMSFMPPYVLMNYIIKL